MTNITNDVILLRSMPCHPLTNQRHRRDHVSFAFRFRTFERRFRCRCDGRAFGRLHHRLAEGKVRGAAPPVLGAATGTAAFQPDPHRNWQSKLTSQSESGVFVVPVYHACANKNKSRLSIRLNVNE